VYDRYKRAILPYWRRVSTLIFVRLAAAQSGMRSSQAVKNVVVSLTVLLHSDFAILVSWTLDSNLGRSSRLSTSTSDLTFSWMA